MEHWSNYAGERYDGRFRVSNRLTMGDSENPKIRPTIKIACSRKGEFAVRVMMAPMPGDPKDRWYVPIGEWFMFNAVLTAATPDSNHAYAAAITLSHTGLNYVMRDSQISWWSGDLFRSAIIFTRYLTLENRTLSGMVFEHGDSADGNYEALDCVFRNLNLARRNQGATLCVFENNKENILLDSSHVGVMLTDCIFRPPARPMRIPRSTREEQWLQHRSIYKPLGDFKLIMNPGVVERVSLPVKVVDMRDRPLAGAAVMLDCPADTAGWAVVRPLAVTDADGLTPADGDRALMIIRHEWRPTDNPAMPQPVTYSYTVAVAAPNYKTYQSQFNSAGDIPRPLIITLQPEK